MAYNYSFPLTLEEAVWLRDLVRSNVDLADDVSVNLYARLSRLRARAKLPDRPQTMSDVLLHWAAEARADGNGSMATDLKTIAEELSKEE